MRMQFKKVGQKSNHNYYQLSNYNTLQIIKELCYITYYKNCTLPPDLAKDSSLVLAPYVKKPRIITGCQPYVRLVI